MDFVAKETEFTCQEKLLVELALELISQGGGEISVTGGFAEKTIICLSEQWVDPTLRQRNGMEGEF